MILEVFLILFQQDPITQELAKQGGNALEQITILNPILGLLLVLLFGIIVALSVVVYKLSKKMTALSQDLYKEAKSDFELVLAFEKKLDSLIEKNELASEDIKNIREAINGLKTYLEIMYKQ